MLLRQYREHARLRRQLHLELLDERGVASDPIVELPNESGVVGRLLSTRAETDRNGQEHAPEREPDGRV